MSGREALGTALFAVGTVIAVVFAVLLVAIVGTTFVLWVVGTYKFNPYMYMVFFMGVGVSLMVIGFLVAPEKE